ncbi:hypothetical protein [Staphylococcus phage vB_Sau_P68]|nr:hypothetical protein SAP23_GM000020 [Staphylococcus phage SAP23]UJQ43216.1 hypothetical protein [Staphylococcus phage vB_Sau_P68]
MTTLLNTNDSELKKLNNSNVEIIKPLSKSEYDFNDSETYIFICKVDNKTIQLFEDEILFK